MNTATMSQFKTAVEGLGQGFEQFKSEHERSVRERDSLLDAKLKRIADDIGQKHEEALRMISEEVAKGQRPGEFEPDGTTEEQKLAKTFSDHRKSVQDPNGDNFHQMRATYGKEYPGYESADVASMNSYAKAFRRYLAVGQKSNLSLMATEHQKDMSIGIDPDGGYFLLPPTISSRVVQRVFETSPMREIADVIPITSRSLVVPEDTSDIDAGWVGEHSPRPATNTITPGRVEIPAQEMYAEPALSQQLLEDSGFDVDGYIGDKLAKRFARLEATSFVSGNGVAKPKGFLSYPTVVVSSGSFAGFNQLERVNSGTPGEFTYSGLTRLVTSLKDPYQDNAKFLIRRQSIFYILNLTDGNGRLIFQPLINGNLNKTPLLGYELRYATDMPDVAAGANAMAFGDWMQGYQIVDRVGISVLRDPYTAKPFVLLYTRKRVGGAVKDFDAIKIHSLQ